MTTDLPLTRYVAGFMFDPARQNVALIRKSKPVWQAGKLNGIGGKIEIGESPVMAMVREWKEETGGSTYSPIESPQGGHNVWTHFLHMYGVNDCGRESFSVDFFLATGPLDKLLSLEAEQVELHALSTINPLRHDMIENLPWLISLAYDTMTDGRPAFTVAHYDFDTWKQPCFYCHGENGAHTATCPKTVNAATKAKMPQGEMDAHTEQARSLHRVVRALHDGHCPRCAAIFPAEEARQEFSETCPTCGFSITHTEAAAAVEEFSFIMSKSLAVFEEWRAKRPKPSA